MNMVNDKATICLNMQHVIKKYIFVGGDVVGQLYDGVGPVRVQGKHLTFKAFLMPKLLNLLAFNTHGQQMITVSSYAWLNRCVLRLHLKKVNGFTGSWMLYIIQNVLSEARKMRGRPTGKDITKKSCAQRQQSYFGETSGKLWSTNKIRFSHRSFCELETETLKLLHDDWNFVGFE